MSLAPHILIINWDLGIYRFMHEFKKKLTTNMTYNILQDMKNTNIQSCDHCVVIILWFVQIYLIVTLDIGIPRYVLHIYVANNISCYIVLILSYE